MHCTIWRATAGKRRKRPWRHVPPRRTGPRSCWQDFKLDHGQSIATLLPYREIYEGNKRKHGSGGVGVAYCDMIFFDDYMRTWGATP